MSRVNIAELIDRGPFNRFYLTVFALLFLLILFDGYDQGVYGTALPSLIEESGLSPSVFGLIASFTLYGMMAGGIVLGMLADKIGRKATLILGTVIFCVGTGLFGFMSEPIGFTICRALAGFGLAGVSPVAITLATEYSPIKNRATIVTVVTAGVPIGTMLAPLVGLLILPQFGWRPMYWIGFIPLVMVVLIPLFIPESMDVLLRKNKSDEIKRILGKAQPGFVVSEDSEFVIAAEEKIQPSFFGSFTSLFKDGKALNTLLLWLVFGLIMFTVYCMTTWLPQLMKIAGYNLDNSLFFMLIFTLGSIPGVGISGRIANIFGYKKTIIAYVLMAAVMIMAVSSKPSFVILSVLLFFVGAGIFGGMGLIFAYTSQSYENSIRATAVGWASAMGRFGGSFGPLITGLLIANNVSLPINFMVFALALAAVGIAVGMTKDRTREVQTSTASELSDGKSALSD